MNMFELKPGDRKYALKYQLSDYEASSGLLTGASVQFQMRNRSGVSVIDEAATVLDADGIVAYEWQAGDTTTPGFYDAEFVVTFSDGLKQHYPSRSFITVGIYNHVEPIS